jgi:hypothetical protein
LRFLKEISKNFRLNKIITGDKILISFLKISHFISKDFVIIKALFLLIVKGAGIGNGFQK